MRIDLFAAQPEHSPLNRWLCIAVCAVILWLWILDLVGIFSKDDKK